MCGMVLILLKIRPKMSSQMPHITNPARICPASLSRKVQSNPKIRVSAASG